MPVLSSAEPVKLQGSRILETWLQIKGALERLLISADKGAFVHESPKRLSPVLLTEQRHTKANMHLYAFCML